MSVEVVERAQRGDHAAFETLARASSDRLYSVARRVLGDPGAAEDAVQECFIRAWRNIRALREPERFDAWLYRLLLNACRDEQRRSQRRVVTIDMGTLEPAAEDAIGEVPGRDELERAFARLSVDHRMALVLHHLIGLRPAEIAATLGIASGTVASRLHYGARALRAALATPAEPGRGGTGR